MKGNIKLEEIPCYCHRTNVTVRYMLKRSVLLTPRLMLLIVNDKQTLQENTSVTTDLTTTKSVVMSS